jgi:hypothetical protein
MFDVMVDPIRSGGDQGGAAVMAGSIIDRQIVRVCGPKPPRSIFGRCGRHGTQILYVPLGSYRRLS